MSEPSLSNLSASEQAAVSDYVAAIREQFPDEVLSAALYGSKARGDAHAESDIDLLVLVDKENREIQSALWRIASDVSLEYNLVLSVRVYAKARWAESQRIGLPLYRAIVADGVPLTPERVPAGLTR